MLHMSKEFFHNKNEKMKFKLYKKLEIIVIIQENLEQLLTAFVIEIIKYPKKFMQKLIMVQNMITTS